MTIVERLKRHIESLSIPLTKVTEETGIPSDRMRQWINGRGNPKSEDERKIEAWLDGTLVPKQVTKPAEDYRAKYISLLESQVSTQSSLEKQLSEIKESLSAVKPFLEGISERVGVIAIAVLNLQRDPDAAADSANNLVAEHLRQSRKKDSPKASGKGKA